MWRVIWFFLGVTRLQVTGASPEWCLQRLAKARVPFHFCGKPDAFTAGIWILRRDDARVTRLVRAAGFECRVEERGGFPAIFGGLQRRLWLPVLLLAAAAAAVIVPKFVFFYTVEGNETVPSAQILRELQELGVGFGTYGKSIQPQWVKNHMLFRIPELQWLTVTQNGACATVVVRERPEREPVLDRKTPQNVVASRAGVITEVLCFDGNCLVSPGQAVESGQLLVSAYTDLEYKTPVSAARAEIYAKTVRHTETVLPETALQKRPSGTRRQLSLLLGNRRICLWGGGNSGSNCDKSTERRFFALPGGYFLPVGLEIVTIFSYDTYETEADADAVRESLEQLAARRIREDLIAGTAEQLSYRFTREDGCFRLETRAECEEMIARQTGAAFIKDGDQ